MAGVGGSTSKSMARPNPFYELILLVFAAVVEAAAGASTSIAEGGRALANAAAAAALVSTSLFSLGMIDGSWSCDCLIDLAIVCFFMWLLSHARCEEGRGGTYLPR